MKLEIEEIPDKAYGGILKYAVTFGDSHLAYGETPEDAIAQFEKYFNVSNQNVSYEREMLQL